MSEGCLEEKDYDLVLLRGSLFLVQACLRVHQYGLGLLRVVRLRFRVAQGCAVMIQGCLGVTNYNLVLSKAVRLWFNVAKAGFRSVRKHEEGAYREEQNFRANKSRFVHTPHVGSHVPQTFIGLANSRNNGAHTFDICMSALTCANLVCFFNSSLPALRTLYHFLCPACE